MARDRDPDESKSGALGRGSRQEILSALSSLCEAADDRAKQRNRCPICGKNRALMRVSWEGQRVADLCRFCHHFDAAIVTSKPRSH